MVVHVLQRHYTTLCKCERGAALKILLDDPHSTLLACIRAQNGQLSGGQQLSMKQGPDEGGDEFDDGGRYCYHSTQYNLAANYTSLTRHRLG